jgi:CheY-like chemotaxis protein
MEKVIVLYVDDEKDQLELFGRCIGKYFKVLTADSGQKALEILKREKVDAVVSDERMSPMSGIEFLKGVQKISPCIPRIMLTAHTNEEVLLRAINEGPVHGFFQKPVGGRALELRQCVQRELDKGELQRVVQEKKEQLEQALIDLKFAQEQRIAADRLEHRYRVINEVAHNVNNPFCVVEGWYQVIKKRVTKFRGEEGSMKEGEKVQLLKGIVEILLDNMSIPMERVAQELRTLYEHVKEEGDPDGIPSSPMKESAT